MSDTRPILGLEAFTERLEEKVPELAGAIYGAATFADLVEQDLMPEVTPAAFVLWGGLRGGQAQAAAGAFVQDYDKTLSVVLAERYADDPSGAKAAAAAEPLIEQVILAIVGWAPEDAIGVWRLASAEFVGAKQGALVSQIDFALIDQLRIF